MVRDHSTFGTRCNMMELSTILPKELPRSLSIHITCLVKSRFPVVKPHINVNHHSVTIGNKHTVHINDHINNIM